MHLYAALGKPGLYSDPRTLKLFDRNFFVFTLGEASI